MTRQEIAAVISKLPGLNYQGNGLGSEGRKLSADERVAKLKKEQDDLLASADVCTKVCQWLDGVVIIRQPWRGSYGLKHDVERDIGQYVSNGQFIAAAIHCGIPYKVIPDSLNLDFAISKKWLKAKDEARSQRKRSPVVI